MTGPTDNKNKQPLCFATRAIKSVGEDAFIFHCVAKFGTYKLNRNMIVLKNKAGQLTLINPLLLTPAGETALVKLGGVKHIIRLGTSFNFYDGSAVEDKYYLSKFPNCRRWAPGKLKSCPKLPVHKVLKKGVDLPHPDAKCFVMYSTVEPEAVILLSREKGGNMLIAGDCLQHQVDNSYINTPTVARLKVAGLMKERVVVSPLWLHAMAPPEGLAAVGKSLSNLANTKFHRFISTSGNIMLKQEAKQGVVDAIQKAFDLQT